MSEQEKDWRIGLNVKPKYRGNKFSSQRGVVIDVIPSQDAAGRESLRILLDDGNEIVSPVEYWINGKQSDA